MDRKEESEPIIFNSAIVKLTAYCNLNCTYCYMFNQSDKTYTRVPKNMSIQDADMLLYRIEEHAKTHGLKQFTISLHGGEPALWPLSSFTHFFDSVDRIRKNGLRLHVGVQTNAYWLNPQLLRLFADHRVTLGVSLDGPKYFNDTRRPDHLGGGSYDRVIENLKLLKKDYPEILSGVLCVADPAIPPAEFLDWIDSLPIRRVDVLWPMEFNYRSLPWGQADFNNYCNSPRYGKWFSELFELWWKRDDPTLVIRLFIESLLALLGSLAHTDMLVNNTIDMLVINTDGAIEYHDYLRPYSDGATRTEFNIRNNAFDDLATDSVFQFLHKLGEHLPKECHGCGVAKLCGGGYLPGRMHPDSKFPSRRSVLCPDEYHFFRTVYKIMKRGQHDDSGQENNSSMLPPYADRLNY
jgi:uncharacterized protein